MALCIYRTARARAGGRTVPIGASTNGVPGAGAVFHPARGDRSSRTPARLVGVGPGAQRQPRVATEGYAPRNTRLQNEPTAVRAARRFKLLRKGKLRQTASPATPRRPA